MKKNLIDAAVRQEVIDRIKKLHPDSQKRWGTMTASQMLAHLLDAFLMAFNKRPCSNRSNFLTRSIIKWVILWGARMPKNVPTAPELDQKKKGTPPAEWETDVQKLLDLIQEFATMPENQQLGVHPLFGKMNRKEWGRLGYQHTDHHLLQFGV